MGREFGGGGLSRAKLYEILFICLAFSFRFNFKCGDVQENCPREVFTGLELSRMNCCRRRILHGRKSPWESFPWENFSTEEMISGMILKTYQNFFFFFFNESTVRKIFHSTENHLQETFWGRFSDRKELSGESFP